MVVPRVACRGSPTLGAVQGGFEEGRWPVGGGARGEGGGRAIPTVVQEARRVAALPRAMDGSHTTARLLESRTLTMVLGWETSTVGCKKKEINCYVV